MTHTHDALRVVVVQHQCLPMAIHIKLQEPLRKEALDRLVRAPIAMARADWQGDERLFQIKFGQVRCHYWMETCVVQRKDRIGHEHVPHQ